MRFGCLLILAGIPWAVVASEYPTNPEEQDKLCEAIGETPNIAVPPRDRLFMKENCTCAGETGCGKLGSKRFSDRLDAANRAAAEQAARRAKANEAARAATAEARRADQARREAVAKRKAAAAAGRKRTAEKRINYFECTAGSAGSCDDLLASLKSACKANGLGNAECLEKDGSDYIELAIRERDAGQRRLELQRGDSQRADARVAAHDKCIDDYNVIYVKCEGARACISDADAKRDACLHAAKSAR